MPLFGILGKFVITPIENALKMKLQNICPLKSIEFELTDFNVNSGMYWTSCGAIQDPYKLSDLQ